jgi:hypothetical protein
MSLPNLTKGQIEWVTQQVAIYIEGQRRKFRQVAAPLNREQKRVMLPFFPESTLISARVARLRGIRVGNPPFYEELVRMGFDLGSLPDFARMNAITFVDTIVSHVRFTDELLFHELVHVVQFQKLGVAEFVVKYVRGFLTGGSYEAIPLEMNAYELEARFKASPRDSFSVEAEVQSRMDAGRF